MCLYIYIYIYTCIYVCVHTGWCLSHLEDMKVNEIANNLPSEKDVTVNPV